MNSSALSDSEVAELLRKLSLSPQAERAWRAERERQRNFAGTHDLEALDLTTIRGRVDLILRTTGPEALDWTTKAAQGSQIDCAREAEADPAKKAQLERLRDEIFAEADRLQADFIQRQACEQRPSGVPILPGRMSTHAVATKSFERFFVVGLTKCSDCGGDVSTSANSCPTCGKPIAHIVRDTSQNVAKNMSSGCCGIITLIVLLGTIGAWLESSCAR
ncbi:MAG TPA: hypothetical protein VFC07_03975 [Verrucomicrobiae bacterium]|nr:hypothetical protein [Verrucomicrobiae bacterium]